MTYSATGGKEEKYWSEYKALEADNLTAICGTIVYKMWEPRRLTTLWASKASYRNVLGTQIKI
jgi:hypothetical protein